MYFLCSITLVEAKKKRDNRHNDYCYVCKKEGDILLCDGKKCVKAAHHACVDVSVDLPASEPWYCDTWYNNLQLHITWTERIHCLVCFVTVKIEAQLNTRTMISSR